MSGNYISVLYYALYEKYASDIDAFHDFICGNVHCDDDVMALFTDCDLTDVQIRAIQIDFSLSEKILLKFRDRLDWSLVGPVEYRTFDDATVNKLKDYVSWSYVFPYSRGVSEIRINAEALIVGCTSCGYTYESKVLFVGHTQSRFQATDGDVIAGEGDSDNTCSLGEHQSDRKLGFTISNNVCTLLGAFLLILIQAEDVVG